MEDSLTEQRRDVRRFGSFTMAYSTLQPGMEVFRHPEFEGFVGFQRSLGVACILSHPVTAAKDYKKATALFLEKFPATVVCQASQDYANILLEFNFYVTGFGVENILPMKDFEVSSRVRPNLKRFMTRLKNLGFTIEEDHGDGSQVRDINNRWLAAKQNKKEFRFLARPFISNEEPDVRFFLLKKDGEVLGFCAFDPIYSSRQDGSIESYVLQHLRVIPSAPSGAADFLLINCLKIFQAEGRETISLGLSLLYQRARPLGTRNFLREFLLDVFYHSSTLYRCKTVGQHKDRYHAGKVHTFLGFSPRAGLRGHLSVMGVNGL